MIAADSGHAGIVELLIEAGANLEQVDEVSCDIFLMVLSISHWALDCTLQWSGHTALMKAASNGHPQVVEMLVRAGADLQLKDAVSATCAKRMCLCQR